MVGSWFLIVDCEDLKISCREPSCSPYCSLHYEDKDIKCSYQLPSSVSFRLQLLDLEYQSSISRIGGS
jgi:hypothetical protein